MKHLFARLRYILPLLLLVATVHAAPNLTSVSILSSGVHPEVLTGETILLSFSTDVPVQSPTVEILGRAVDSMSDVSGGAGTSWQALLAVLSTDPDTVVPFTILAQDFSGNLVFTDSVTTDSSQVIVDNLLPVVTSLLMTSTGTTPGIIHEYDAAHLQVTTNEKLGLFPTVQLLGRPAAVSWWFSNYFEVGSVFFPCDPTGPVTFSFTVTDTAGNISPTYTATTDGSSVVAVDSPPVATLVHIESNNADPALAYPGDTITVSFTSSESLTSKIGTIFGRLGSLVHTGSNSWIFTTIALITDATGIVPFSESMTDCSANTGSFTSSTDGSFVVLGTPPVSIPSTSNPSKPRYSGYVRGSGTWAGKFWSTEETQKDLDQINAGYAPKIRTYINWNGYEIFAGYRSGHLPLSKFDRIQNKVVYRGDRVYRERMKSVVVTEINPAVKDVGFFVRAGSLAERQANMKARFQRPDKIREAIVRAPMPRRRAGDEVISEIARRLHHEQVAINKFERRTSFPTRPDSVLLVKDMNTMKMRIGGKSVPLKKIFSST